ncbi:MAG: hypothetical protein BWY91_01145 [bacterium ADurb.BinA028]|nr:MAG: hypothetical protein BWY91_01145 [bacterium ADurb.BinA028]
MLQDSCGEAVAIVGRSALRPLGPVEQDREHGRFPGRADREIDLEVGQTNAHGHGQALGPQGGGDVVLMPVDGVDASAGS